MSNHELQGVDNSLLCRVQSTGAHVDCDALLVSDGTYWTCPYGHIQGFDGLGNPVRKIQDRRASVKR